MSSVILTNSWDNNNSMEKKNMVDEKSPMMDDLYKIAGDVLREDDNTKKQCLDMLRDWIKQNSDIQNCIIDDNFLLRFLRVKKFSVPMAQQMLLKYLNFRKRFSHVMLDLDYTEKIIDEIFSAGYVFASPFKDKNGRRVIIYNLKNFDINKYSSRDMYKAHAITYETLVCDEETQIMGVNHIGDTSGVNPSWIPLFSITEFATLIRWGEQSYPMMHKEVNVLNVPTALKYVFDFAKTNMSPKLRDRLSLHDSLEELHKKVDKHCLPLEFGGVMPIKEMVGLWKQELAIKRDRLLSYDKMNLLSDKGIITRRNPQVNKSIDSLPGSFRKLEVD